MHCFIRIVFAFTICLIFLGCANFDGYNRNPFYKENNNSDYNRSKQVEDSNRFKIIPFNSDPEQITYATDLSRIMTGFGLTLVESFDEIEKDSAETTAIESVEARESKPEEKSTIKDKDQQNSLSGPNLSNADKNEKYIIDAMFIKGTDGTIRFTRISDNKVMGIFTISPYVFKMRPQLYAALVNMKLLKGIRYL